MARGPALPITACRVGDDGPSSGKRLRAFCMATHRPRLLRGGSALAWAFGEVPCLTVA
jgi:hypothetical protein